MDITKKHSTDIITQKYIKMSNMDITNKQQTQKYIQDEQHGHHQKTKYNTEIYKDEQHGRHHKQI